MRQIDGGAWTVPESEANTEHTVTTDHWKWVSGSSVWTSMVWRFCHARSAWVTTVQMQVSTGIEILRAAIVMISLA
jgi:hypothetical protein